MGRYKEQASLQDIKKKIYRIDSINRRIRELYRLSPAIAKNYQIENLIDGNFGANALRYKMSPSGPVPQISKSIENVLIMSLPALDAVFARIPTKSEAYNKYYKEYEADKALQREGSLFPTAERENDVADDEEVTFWGWLDVRNSIEERKEEFLQTGKYHTGDGDFWKLMDRMEDGKVTWSSLDARLRELGY